MNLSLKYFTVLLITFSLQNGWSQSQNSASIKEISFDMALIYQYVYPDSEGEFWMYYNTENGNILYVPEDEMIDFVIADSLGNYYTFGDNGHDEKVVSVQTLPHLNFEMKEANFQNFPQSNDYFEFIKLTEKRIIDQQNISQPNIESIGYKMLYQKMTGQQNVFVTENIPVNAYILYGFNLLEGDVKLPVAEYNFLNIFENNQLVTHIERDNFMLKLISYEYNPYMVDLSIYKYYIQNEGEWILSTLPL